MKLNRHAKILELIKVYPITTQEELLEKLREEGYSVTQSTVSRDINTLRLQKTHHIDGKQRYTAPVGIQPDIKNGFNGILSGSIISLEVAMNLVVVKTFSGMASAACAAIDSMSLQNVVGSLAGDDTIFIACKDEAAAFSLKEAFKDYIV
ncbi:MAG: arginine repressor [Ruminococcaceae bacterium]|nr:arginine repressor [Oscillospiraceae bacterium]